MQHTQPALPSLGGAVGHRALLGFALALTVLAVHAVLAVINVYRVADIERRVSQSYEMQAAVQAAFSQLQDAEIGERGYLITGDESYRDSYRKAKDLFERELAKIRLLTKDSPELRPVADELARRAQRKLSEVEYAMQVRDNEGFDAAREALTTVESPAMAEVRDWIKQLLDKEEKVLDERSQQSSDAVEMATSASLVVGLLGVGVICIAYGLVRREIVQRRDAQLFQQSVLDSLSSHIAVLDERGVILEVNDAWRRFGEDNGFILESVGQNYLDVCQTAERDSDEGERMAEGIRDVIAGRRTHFVMQYPCHSDEQQRWFVVRVTRFAIPGPVRVVVAHDDVTHRVLAEEAVAQSNRRKDEFLAMLGHELRNPLAGIVTSAQVLSMLPPDDPDCEKMQAVIQRQAGHMVRMVDDLLDVSRIARGKLTLQRTRLDLVQLVRQSLDDYCQSHPDDQLAVEADLHREQLWVLGDATRLQQVVTNLIHNACKFSEGACRLRVRLVADPAGQARLSVRDYGIGMTRETLAAVFEPFNQAENSIDRTRGGIGMGLALVKGLVGLHEGRVAARSDGLGKGSEFIIELPLASIAAEPERPAATQDQPMRGRRVLLIDDTKDALFPLERLLTKGGMEVATAMDGPSGLTEARRFRPDVILCDIGLPGMDGYAVAAAVREDPVIHDVYMVAVTGYGQEEDRRMAQEAGFDYHLTKPVSKASLDQVMTAFPRFEVQPAATQ